MSFVPLPTRLVAEHTTGADARTASLLYGATLTGCAIAFNLIWHHLARAELLVAGLTPEFVRDVTIRYLLGLVAYAAATLLPLLTVVVSVLLALMFALGPSLRPAFAPTGEPGERG